jgi:uncharacterized protein (DUF1501 family)
MTYSKSRREFLRKSGCGALTATALLSGFDHFGLISAKAQQVTGYKALVCIFLNGGNDSANMVIPFDDYAEYATARPVVNIPKAELLRINPPSEGREFGFHPSMTGLHELWGQQKVAILCNAGTLVRLITKDEYRNKPNLRPYQLLSHSDQQNQWQTSMSRPEGRLSGWGGRLADKMSSYNNSKFPLCTSIAGNSLFGRGIKINQVVLSPHPTALNGSLALNGFNNTPESVARRKALEEALTIDHHGAKLVKSANDISLDILETGKLLNANPTIAGFPNTTLGNQLYQVAKVISLRNTIGTTRQVFFCQLGGFDTHRNQIGQQANLLRQVSAAMKAFYDVLTSMGMESQVTTFTLSEFGRTGIPNDVGTDHGWGGHQIIMGGAVKGGDFYGTAGPYGTIFPSFAKGGQDDIDVGNGARLRTIPTVSVDQYAATLAKWFDVDSAGIKEIFPNIDNFPTADLGFMSS